MHLSFEHVTIYFQCSAVYESKPEMIAAAISLASLIASKSPVAVQGSKVNLNYSRGRTVDEGLEFLVSIFLTFVYMQIFV